MYYQVWLLVMVMFAFKKHKIVTMIDGRGHYLIVIDREVNLYCIISLLTTLRHVETIVLQTCLIFELSYSVSMSVTTMSITTLSYCHLPSVLYILFSLSLSWAWAYISMYLIPSIILTLSSIIIMSFSAMVNANNSFVLFYINKRQNTKDDDALFTVQIKVRTPVLWKYWRLHISMQYVQLLKSNSCCRVNQTTVCLVSEWIDVEYWLLIWWG